MFSANLGAPPPTLWSGPHLVPPGPSVPAPGQCCSSASLQPHLCCRLLLLLAGVLGWALALVHHLPCWELLMDRPVTSPMGLCPMVRAWPVLGHPWLWLPSPGDLAAPHCSGPQKGQTTGWITMLRKYLPLIPCKNGRLLWMQGILLTIWLME